MIYLDIVLLVNGAMDAFLIVFTAYLLRKRISRLNLLLAVLLGEIPILFVLFDMTGLVAISRLIIPLLMVGIGLRTRTVGDLAKGLLYFSLLAACCGGIYFALAGWLGLTGGDGLYLSLRDLWILPVTALAVMGGYRIWVKVQKANLMLDNILFDAELSFDNGENLKIKALLDTGNELRDPLTGTPVMLLEERVAYKFVPEKIRQFLELPWRQSSNPWSYIWNDEEFCIHKLVFISAKGINGQTWLPAIRLGKMKVRQGEREWEQPVTVALVPQILSAESKFQALLHPEHIQKSANKEEIA